MKIIRYQTNSELKYGILKDNIVYELQGDIFGDFSLGRKVKNLSEIEVRAPIDPPNIIAIGLNYRKHAAESASEIPDKPLIFLKATNSVIGRDSNIILPKNAPDEVDYEAELAFIIAEDCKDVEIEKAKDYILGYCCANDISARDCQKRIDKQWARAKSFDTFCPLGPWIETELEPDNLKISSILNGEIMQDSNTSDMIFNVRDIVSYCSKNMTLLPRTVILTGTPEGVGMAREPELYLQPGDRIEVEIEGIGKLGNDVVAE